MQATLQPTSSRLYFLDWVRIAAFGLLVVYHVGMYYVTWEFHIKSPFADAWLEPFMRLSSPWRMSLLFLISGAATAFMLARAGASRELISTRAKRLLLPLLFGMLVIVPPQSYVEVMQQFGYAGSFTDFMQLYLKGNRSFCSKPGTCLILPTWNHLWFLPYLFFHTVLLWLLVRRYPRALVSLADYAAQHLHGIRLLCIPIVFFALARILLGPVFGITYSLVDDWYAHAQYGAAFLLGAVMTHPGTLFWQRIGELRWHALALALFAWAATLVLVTLAPPVRWPVAGGLPAAQLATMAARAVAHAVMQWCAIVAAIGFAQRHWNVDNAMRRYLTNAVFPVYIVHQTLILLLAVALLPLALRPAIEAPLIIAATFALSFLIYEVVRRIGWLRPCFGLTATLLLTMATAHAQAPAPSLSVNPPSVLGEWWTPGFGARVKLERCFNEICGHIVWVWDDAPGQIADQRPLVGRKVVEGMRQEATNAQRWSGGTLYNPEDGRHYKGALTLAAANRLTLEGCVLMICKSQTWRRYDSQRTPPIARDSH